MDNEALIQEAKVTSLQVASAEMLATITRHFPRGMDGLLVENTVFAKANQMIHGYMGGAWTYHETSNGAFYMKAPGGAALMVESPNGAICDISPDATGVVVTLMALSHLSFRATSQESQDNLAEKFHLLRDYAVDHPESSAIFDLID